MANLGDTPILDLIETIKTESQGAMKLFEREFSYQPTTGNVLNDAEHAANQMMRAYLTSIEVRAIVAAEKLELLAAMSAQAHSKSVDEPLS